MVLALNRFHFGCPGTVDRFLRMPTIQRLHIKVTLHIEASTLHNQRGWTRIMGKDLVKLRRLVGVEGLEIVIIQSHRKVVPKYEVPSRNWLPELCDLGNRSNPYTVRAHDKKALREKAEILLLNVTLPNLKSCQVMITDHHWMMVKEPMRQRPGFQVWSYEEKSSWVKFFRKTILGVVDEEEEEALGGS